MGMVTSGRSRRPLAPATWTLFLSTSAATNIAEVENSIPTPILCNMVIPCGWPEKRRKKGTKNRSYMGRRMRTLTSSKIDKEAGGKEKLEVILWSIVAPCSTENVSICDRAVQTRIVLAQIGTTFSIIFTSSTCVTVHRCQGLMRLRLLESFNPTGIAARSRNLKFKRYKISSQDLI